MNSKPYVPPHSSPPFQTLTEACRTTGLSTYFLRKGCKAGTVPHIMCGAKYLVDVPSLLTLLRTQESRSSQEGA